MHKIFLTGSVAQWITRLTTNQEIAGSTPARLEVFLSLIIFGSIFTWIIDIDLILIYKYFFNF